MELTTIPLDRLRPHPANANVMPEELLAKLVERLRETGRYPPLIVRPLPTRPDPPPDQAQRAPGDGGAPDAPADGGAGPAAFFQLLDGHHRAEALRRLGVAVARCLVWEVDDAGALELLATLNRLRGRDDPGKRADLLEGLRRQSGDDLAALARRVPEDLAALTRLLALRHPPRLAPPPDLAAMPVCVHFFLLPPQQRRLEARLAELGGPREAALMALVEAGPAPRR